MGRGHVQWTQVVCTEHKLCAPVWPVCRTECAEGEKAAAEKRDVVKAKVDEINMKLSELNENKKEKMKDAKKMRKCVTIQFAYILAECFDSVC